ncbi:response regulator transcription factor [Radiobacillus deserti]|uniref:Response regulator transcription factor n=1 Tax=Radiobacillus deserti TaxID=2594883 RepID=A0A516KDZ6_9BACI|nr:response regulator transcription factor [Radiobacillus deserti]QDP39633.1 response regulator transcription factor [Radiobacillus deserti]
MVQLCKVLIVDDEMLIRQGIINYMNWESEGFQIVDQSSNGEEALSLIEKHKPHVVITDIVMPVMDGTELVKVIKRDYPDIEVVVLSSFENFDYVHSTFKEGIVDYILKPKLTSEELLESLYKAVKRIPNFEFCKNTQKIKPSTSKQLQQVIHGSQEVDKLPLLDFSYPYFCLIFFFSASNRYPTRNYLSTTLSRYVTSYQLEELVRDESELTYLVNMNRQSFEPLNTNVQALMGRIRADFPDLQLFVNHFFSNVRSLKEEYERSKARMKQLAFYLPTKSIFLPDLLLEESESQVELDRTSVMKLYKQHQVEEAIFQLLDYIDSLSKQYDLPVEEFKSLIGNQMFDIIVALGSLNYNTDSLERDKYSLFTTLNEAKTVKEALLPFYQFLDYTRDIAAPKKVKRQDGNMKKLLEYVNQHYAEPLGLTELAEHFHFNPSYLSNYFSTHHGEGFSEYVNKVRITKACELLKKSKQSISNISEEVGYSDPSYFSKVFKKMVGVSPSQFRRDEVS